MRSKALVPCLVKKSTKGLTLNWLSRFIFSGYFTFLLPACLGFEPLCDKSSHISFRFERIVLILMFVKGLATTNLE